MDAIRFWVWWLGFFLYLPVFALCTGIKAGLDAFPICLRGHFELLRFRRRQAALSELTAQAEDLDMGY